jgi:Amt family ammonium transporter
MDFFVSGGVLDFAGGTVVHMSAGYAALAGAMFLGPRTSFGDSKHTEPANIPFVILGTGMLWFGWFGFNAGSSLGANLLAIQAFATTIVASATAMMGWIFFDAARGKKISAMGACIGAVVGLVAITPAAGFVTIPQSIFIGFISAVISNLAVRAKNKSNLDDTLDVFPCHGLGGISGMLLTGIFAKEVGLFYGQTHTFLYHLLALVIISVYTFVGSYILYYITDKIVSLRVSVEEENFGLDLSQHGESYKLKKIVGQ